MRHYIVQWGPVQAVVQANGRDDALDQFVRGREKQGDADPKKDIGRYRLQIDSIEFFPRLTDDKPLKPPRE